METGDVVFVRGHGPIDKMVELFSGEFSHTAIFTSPNTIFEAQYGVLSHTVPFHYKDYCVVRLPFTKEEISKTNSIVKGLSGKKYNYREIPWILLQIIFGKHLIPNWVDPKEMICSEADVEFLEGIGFLKTDKSLEDITPTELFDHLLKIGGVVYYDTAGQQ
jgi:hypothetical protein